MNSSEGFPKPGGSCLGGFHANHMPTAEPSSLDGFFPGFSYHLHRSASGPSDARAVEHRLSLREASFGEEQLLRDTFFCVSKTGRELWLRKRRILQQGSHAPTWMLSETWPGKAKSLFRLQEWHGVEAIRAELLRRAGDIENASALKNSNTSIETLFPMVARFRFLRREAVSPLFGRISMDEMLNGITFTASVNSKLEYENALSVLQPLEPSFPKLTLVLDRLPVSWWICGDRGLNLEWSGSDDDDEWQAEAEADWNCQVLQKLSDMT